MSSKSTSQHELLRFSYKFQFDNGQEKPFEILLDGDTLELRSGIPHQNPEWTKLKFQQCENCPLGDETEYCPVAVNLSSLVDSFRMYNSTDNAFVVVESPERSYGKETSLQKGLSSIMGIYMVTSNCPVMDPLRPMVRFHLPFATTVETVYRSAGMYLLAQYFIQRNGGVPDWKLEKLIDTYRDVGKVNKGMWQRLSAATKLDANVNAIVILNSFGDTLRHFVKSSIDDIERLFSDYIKRSSQ
jgi:hypothetical protein